jgi:3-hydroxy-9,10-secoandrosta-1,3,5(10)-triene-9,17-dione monooxygenase
MSSFYPVHQFMVGWFAQEAKDEYFADGPNTLASTVPGYRNTDRREDGDGLRISGTWGFSSGVDYTKWVLLHTLEEVCLVPRSDYEIIDDWYVSGLRATGSKTVKMDDVHVPPHRS